MGGERRIWPHHADHVVTTRATGEQLVTWHRAARMNTMKPQLGLFLARAADFYAAHLERLRKRAKAAQDKAERETREGKP